MKKVIFIIIAIAIGGYLVYDKFNAPCEQNDLLCNNKE